MEMKRVELTKDTVAFVYPDGTLRIVTSNARWAITDIVNDTAFYHGNTSSALIRRVAKRD